MSLSRVLAQRMLDPNAPKLRTKHIEAFPINKKPKTWVYVVVSMRQGIRLGIVRWYAPWRQYWFEPEEGTGFSWSCGEPIFAFVKALMDERRTSNKTGESI